jgi:Cu+-exporting ATPase
LETSQKINTIVFDKTGTITYGKPQINSIQEIGLTHSEILKFAASVSSRSEHVLAKAIVDRASDEGIQWTNPQNFKAFPGMGSVAEVENKTVATGNRNFLNQLGLNINLDTYQSTETLVMVDNKLAGVIRFSDEPRKEAKSSIDVLKKMGINVILLSGDNDAIATRVASSVGITEVKSEALPRQKSEYIKHLQSKGRVVAMVGDGINDAPALAQSDVGISMGRGTEAAIEAGDITLMREDLRALPAAISLSRVTMRTIKQNLFWAFAYNILLVPVAAGLLHLISGTNILNALSPFVSSEGFLNPIAASSAMAISSICVVLNSINLRRVRL